MSENDTIFRLVLRFCLYLINTCIFLLSCFFFVTCFLKTYLCVFYYCLLENCICLCPASSFSLLPFFPSFSFLPNFLIPTYFFSRTRLPGDYGTRGPEHYTTTGPEDQRSTGAEDDRMRGPQDQRATGREDHRTRGAEELKLSSRGCKYFFPWNIFFFPVSSCHRFPFSEAPRFLVHRAETKMFQHLLENI